MKEIKWHGDTLITSPDYCLVLTEEDYHLALDVLKIPKDGRSPWLLNDQCGATLHTFDDNHVVSLMYTNQVNLIVYGLLVHESVHIWQQFCERIGENSPSIEFEAYSIQRISQNLMSLFDDLTGGLK